MKDQMDWLINIPIAHRGFHSGKKIPENSIPAFENAIKEGFAIELDLQLSKDHKVIVFHDENLKRMTNNNKKVKDCMYQELKQLSLYNTNEKIPLFSETLEVIQGKVPILVEIKNRGKVGRLEEETYKLLQHYKGDFAIQSFNPYSVGYFKQKAPNIIRGQLSGSFRGEKLSPLKKLILSNLLLNKISEPHFISYELNYIDKLPKKYKKQRTIPLLGWTARTPNEYLEGMKKCDNVIFEGFHPKQVAGE